MKDIDSDWHRQGVKYTVLDSLDSREPLGFRE